MFISKDSNVLNKLEVACLMLLINLFSFHFSIAQDASKIFESYYLKYGVYPEDCNRDWCPDGRETEGVANDGKNWFFTSTTKDKTNGIMFKIPAKYVLDQDLIGKPGVNSVAMTELPEEIIKKKLWHWGDADHYKHNGTDYILVPAYNTESAKEAAIIVFKADNLKYVSYFTLDPEVQKRVAWCAISLSGNLFTSQNEASEFYEYELNWDSIINHTKQYTVHLLKENGKHKLFLKNGGMLYNMQGGEFSSSSELLYISCGGGQCFVGQGIYPTDGIHVFDASTFKELQKSTNKERKENSYFDFTFNNKCDKCWFGGGSNTPQGLTVWDLNDDKAPYMSGQLHVLINYYYEGKGCHDDFHLYHFGNKIYVDKEKGAEPEWKDPLPGTKERPFKSFNDAFDWYPIWDGTEIVMNSNLYPEIGSYNKRVKVVTDNGQSIIGINLPWTGFSVNGGRGWYVGDYNGDGKDDILRYHDGDGKADVLLSTGSKFASAVQWTGFGIKGGEGWYVGDYNGDGKDDILRYVDGDGKAEVLLSTGSKFESPVQWTGFGVKGGKGWYVGDYNGDGKDDILRYHSSDGGADVLLSTGSKFKDGVEWTGFGVQGGRGWYVGDYNGDGKDDILRYHEDDEGADILLSTGNKFASAVEWTRFGVKGGQGWYVGDYNGDGKDDILRYHDDDGKADVLLSTGTKFATAVQWTGFGIRGGEGWYVGDYNGDKKDDILRYHYDNGGADVFTSTGSKFE